MCSFDICSWFTCVPLVETIDICYDMLHRSSLSPPDFSERVFFDLMMFTTSSVEFSFNNIMYRQIDGVAMGSPLGPSLANIFVGFHEALLFSRINRPPMYHCYVDDTFFLFNDEGEADSFLTVLNSVHPSLKFTVEKESNCCLSFLDVNSNGFSTSVFRKATFSGLYTRWDSFVPYQRKINLIRTLMFRALKICSNSFLSGEMGFIKMTLSKNGYPLDIFESILSNVIDNFHKVKTHSVKKCPIYLCLPYIGTEGETLARQISRSISNSHFTSNVRVIFFYSDDFVIHS